MNAHHKICRLTMQIILLGTIFISQNVPQTIAQVKNAANGYAPVNGLKMYYEIHGDGPPIVLLHGAFMTIELNWSELIPELSKTRKVIAVELQGHGRTNDTDRPYDHKSLASDVAGLLKHLKIDSTDVIGYSFGGTVALQFGIQYPELVKSLVIISTAYKYDGWLPQVREMLKPMTPAMFDNTPLKTEYEKVAPNPKNWVPFATKLMKFNSQGFDLGAENMKKIKSPALFIMGDNDGVDMKHKADMYQLVGGNVFGDMAGQPKSQLAIIPGTSHVSVMMQTKQLLIYLKPFLKISG
jgi:pimeloyl-ACP methyl ester carboxylesterase